MHQAALLALDDKLDHQFIGAFDLIGAIDALVDCVFEGLGEKSVHPAQERRVNAARKTRLLFVEEAERDEVRALELECEVLLGGLGLILETSAIHPYYFERLVAQVVRFLGIQRKDLKCDLGFGNHDRGNHFGAGLYRGGAAMVSIGRPICVGGAHHDDRLGEAIDLFHHLDHSLQMSGREVALIRGGLHERDWKHREQMPVVANRLLVRGQGRAAIGFYSGRERAHRGGYFSVLRGNR